MRDYLTAAGMSKAETVPGSALDSRLCGSLGSNDKNVSSVKKSKQASIIADDRHTASK